MVHVQINTLSFQFDGVTLLVWAAVGLVAGFLASRVMLGHGMGLVGDLVVGIVGAFIGGYLARLLGVSVTVTGLPIVSQIIIAFVGAFLLLLLLRLFGLGRSRRRVLT